MLKDLDRACRDKDSVNKNAYDHRIIQVRRDLGRSLAQALAQSRVSCEIRIGYSELYPVRS